MGNESFRKKDIMKYDALRWAIDKNIIYYYESEANLQDNIIYFNAWLLLSLIPFYRPHRIKSNLSKNETFKKVKHVSY